MSDDDVTGPGGQVRVNLDDLDTYRSRTEAMSQEFATDSSRSLETLMLFLLGSTDSETFSELDEFGSAGIDNVVKFQRLSQDMTFGLTNLALGASMLGFAYQVSDQIGADGLNRIDSDDVTKLFTARDVDPLQLENVELAKEYEKIQLNLAEQEKAHQERQAAVAQQADETRTAPPGERDNVKVNPLTGAVTVYISNPDPNQPWGPGRSSTPENEIRPDICRVKPGGVSADEPLPYNMLELDNGKVVQKVGVWVPYRYGQDIYTEPMIAPPVECTYDEGARRIPAPAIVTRTEENYGRYPRPFDPRLSESLPDQ